MRSYGWRSLYSGSGFFTAKAVKTVIIINIAVFALINFFHVFSWLSIFGMVPCLVFSKFMIWQLATYMFVHRGLWHLVLNMLMLWFFGRAIEEAWGRKQFLFYYFFTGIGAALCSFIVMPHSYVPVIGASGAIFGILVAYAVMFPDDVILLFFVFPMKMKYAILVLAGINLLGAVSSSGSGIAYFAHLGGALFGYLYLRSEWLKRQASCLSLAKFKLWLKKKDICKKQSVQKSLNREVDLILDKVAKHGMRSLTRKEKRILELKSKVL